MPRTPSKRKEDGMSDVPDKSYITLDNIIKTPERTHVPNGRLTRSARRKMVQEAEAETKEKAPPSSPREEKKRSSSRRRPELPVEAPCAVVVEGVDVAIDTLKACVVIAMLVYMVYLVNNIQNPSLLPGSVPTIDAKTAATSTKELSFQDLLKSLNPLALVFHFAWCSTQMLVVRNLQVASLICAAAELMNLCVSWWLHNTAAIDWRVRAVYVAINFLAIAFGAEIINSFSWAGCDIRSFGRDKHSTFVQYSLVWTSIKGFLLVQFVGSIIQGLTGYNPEGMNMLCRAMLLSLAFHFSTTELHGLADRRLMSSMLQMFWNVFFWGTLLLEMALISVVPDVSGLFKVSAMTMNGLGVAFAFAAVLYGAMSSNTPAAVDAVVLTSIVCALVAQAAAI